MRPERQLMMAGAFVVVGIVALGAVAQFSGPQPRASQPVNEASPDRGLTQAKCDEVERSLAKILAEGGGRMSNPEPGILYMPTQVWTTGTPQSRRGAVGMLGLQKGCRLGVDPAFADIEIRSIQDNTLLVSGSLMDFDRR